MNDEQEDSKSTWLDGIKAHPWITAIFIFCVFIWIGIALVFLPDDWSQLRKVSAGVIWGLFCAGIVTATRTVGTSD